MARKKSEATETAEDMSAVFEGIHDSKRKQGQIDQWLSANPEKAKVFHDWVAVYRKRKAAGKRLAPEDLRRILVDRLGMPIESRTTMAKWLREHGDD